MSFFDRIENALRSRYGTPPPNPPGPAAPGPTLPPGVYVQQNPRRPMSRTTLFLVGGVVLLALYFVLSATRTDAPQPKKNPEYPGADIDKNGITRVMESLRSDAQRVQKAKEAADRQLKEQEALLEAQPTTVPAYSGAPATATPGLPAPAGQTPAPAVDPLLEDRKKKAYTSLFSNPIIPLAPEARSNLQDQPNGDVAARDRTIAGSGLSPVTAVPGNSAPLPLAPPAPAPAAALAPAQSQAEQPHNCLDRVETGKTPLYALCEGSILEARLQNRLVGDFSGPVIAIVERDQYSRDRQHLLIPKGTRLLGEAERNTSTFANRLAVTFHRLILPDGTGRDLKSPGLDAAGATALQDRTDYHLKATVLTTVALGALAGFATAGTGGFYSGTGVDAYRQGISQQAGQTGQQLIGRTLNRPPTITIREGQPVLLYVQEDFHLPDSVPSLPLRSR